MMCLRVKLRAAGMATLVGSLLLTSAAFAGECPAGKILPDATPPGPSAPTGVIDEVIASIDLGAEYDIPGRQFRMRRLEIKPGGVVPWHGHEARPANIYVVKGSVTEYRSNCSVPIEHEKGDVVAESGSVSHWWRNNSQRTAVLISADILPPEMNPDESM